MGADPSGHRDEDQAWADALAVAQFHGVLPGHGHLSEHSRGNVLRGVHSPCV